ncbi:MAG: hexitol phosphatase HxpB [Coriobacteriia bacterium]|nr:hexitol phosphatase HxpB [Coriobacteriia bacterium]
MLRAVIFDMDGLLIDTEQYWWQAEYKAFSSVGVELTKEQLCSTMGMRMDEIVAHWAAIFTEVSFDAFEVIERTYGHMIDFVWTKGQAMPGALEAVNVCSHAGLKLAIASSSYPVLIEAVVEKLDITGYFPVRCSAKDELRGKPDPAVYLSAAQSLGVAPHECLAIEDSAIGLESALSAGMPCIVVPDSEVFDDVRFGAALMKLRSLTEFNDEKLRAIAADLNAPQALEFT